MDVKVFLNKDYYAYTRCDYESTTVTENMKRCQEYGLCILSVANKATEHSMYSLWKWTPEKG